MTDPFDRPARPLDLFNKELGRVEETIAAERMSFCNQCPKLNGAKVCGECHCFMPAKTKLPNASCPLGFWGTVRVMQDDPQKVAVIIDNKIVDVLQGDDRVVAYLLSNPRFVGLPMGTEVNIGDTVEWEEG